MSTVFEGMNVVQKIKTAMRLGSYSMWFEVWHIFHKNLKRLVEGGKENLSEDSA
jgi:hypothetical protein